MSAFKSSILAVALGIFAGRTIAAQISLQVQSRDPQSGATVLREEHVDPARTALVVIDMWDAHWCKTYTARVAGMAPRLNATVRAARALGMQIVWAPSDVLEFYTEYPQRRAMAAIPARPIPLQKNFRPPPAPAGDYCECGPNRPCQSRKAWSRQQAGLTIAASDLIGDCNNGQELLNLAAERKIDTLIYAGVASNLCVCYRSMGMINMISHGLRAFFIADLVEAIMANGFNPLAKTPDLNFTPAKGSALVQQFLEQHIAPSFQSRQLLRLAHPASTEARPHLVFVMADDALQPEATLPPFARRHLEPRYRCTFLAEKPGSPHDIPGLEALADADLLVLSVRHRFLPVPQMDLLERFIRAGKPLVALGSSADAFAESSGSIRQGDGRVVWQDFDREVLACEFNLSQPIVRAGGGQIWIAPGAERHPIVIGLETDRFLNSSWSGEAELLSSGPEVLIRGRKSPDAPEKPVAWTITSQGQRVFYTSLGHKSDFEVETFQKLLANAIDWALGNQRRRL